MKYGVQFTFKVTYFKVIVTGEGKAFCSGLDLKNVGSSSIASKFVTYIWFFQHIQDKPKKILGQETLEECLG